jgi:outer membrane protein assembly factor BamB
LIALDPRLRRNLSTLSVISTLALVAGILAPAAALGGVDADHKPPVGYVAGARSSTTEWPRQYFDLQNDSYNRHETQISKSNVDQLTLAWSAKLRDSATGTGGPIVAGGRVYVGTRSSLDAFDQATGTRLWSFPLGTNTTATGVARWKNLVYVTDVDRHAIFAIDATTGKSIWHLDSTIGTHGPTVIGNVLLFEDFNALRAVKAMTGAPVWTAELPATSFSFPALADGTLYVGGFDSKLHTIDLATGTLGWFFRARGYIEGSVALHEGVAYVAVSIGGIIYAVDTTTHEKLWNYHIGSQVVATPSTAYGLVYVIDYDGVLYAFDAGTGGVTWTAHVGGSNCAPSIANGMVFASGGDDLVQAFDARTGALLWSYDPPGGTAGKIAVVDGTLYFANDVRVFAMRLPAGP